MAKNASQNATAVWKNADVYKRQIQWYEGDPNIRRAIDFLTGPEMLAAGHEENLSRLHHELIHKDWFQTLPDFNAYVVRKEQALKDYACDPMGWRRKCLINIAKAGMFSRCV